jgi:hypothetical protein
MIRNQHTMSRSPSPMQTGIPYKTEHSLVAVILTDMLQNPDAIYSMPFREKHISGRALGFDDREIILHIKSQVPASIDSLLPVLDEVFVNYFNYYGSLPGDGELSYCSRVKSYTIELANDVRYLTIKVGVNPIKVGVNPYCLPCPSEIFKNIKRLVAEPIESTIFELEDSESDFHLGLN